MKILVVFLALCVPAAAAGKQWNTGVLLSYEQQTFTTYSQQKGTGHETPHTTYKIQVDAGDRIYFAERTLNYAWQKFPKVTENGPISWTLKGDKEIVLRDEKGKEFTVTIVKARLKDAVKKQD